MNRDYLEDFIKIAISVHGELHKVTHTDQVDCYSWLDQKYKSHNDWGIKHIQLISAFIKGSGWLITPDAYNGLTQGIRATTKVFFTILYAKDKDKISLSRFETGYGYSPKKGRIFVIRRSHPVMCFSKHIYVFTPTRYVRGRAKYSPRIYTGWRYREEFVPYLTRMLGCGQDALRLGVSYRYMEGCPDQSLVFVTRYGFAVERLLHILKMDGDYNQLMARGGKRVKELCMALRFRIEEDAAPIGPGSLDLIESTMNLLNETVRQSSYVCLDLI